MITERDSRYLMNGVYVVRLYDGFDRIWIDVSSKNLTLPEAASLWDKKTDGGNEHARYDDLDYYDVFPANTTMLFSSEVTDETPRLVTK